MPKTPYFNNAPITEAILDIQTILPENTPLETLAKFEEIVKETFPKKEERMVWESSFQFKPGAAPEVVSPSSAKDGFLFRASDGKKIVQTRLNGFTFNMLKPYSNWEEFNVEANQLWMHYLEIAKPKMVSRVALRYINRIELPLPFKNFKEYIQTVPEIGANIPQALASFFMRLVIPNPDISATAIVTETLEQIDSKNQKLPLILDIDVYKKMPFEPSSDEIWKSLNELRLFKNQIFVNSLTDKTKELFV